MLKISLIVFLSAMLISVSAHARINFRDLEEVKDSAVDLYRAAVELYDQCYELKQAIRDIPGYHEIDELKDALSLGQSCFSIAADAKFQADSAADKLGMAVRSISSSNCVEKWNDGDWNSESQFNNCKEFIEWFEDGQTMLQRAAQTYDNGVDKFNKARGLLQKLIDD